MVIARWLSLIAAAWIGFMPAPANDNYADSEVIASLPYATTVDITDATEEAGDPIPTLGIAVGDSTKTVWWTWTADVTGRVQVSCLGSDFDSMLSVWTGSPGSFVEVVSNDDQSFATESGLNAQLASELVLDAVAGTTYHFLVGRASGSGVSLVFKVWADLATNVISIVQSAAAAAGSFSNVDSQGNIYRFGRHPFYDESALTAGGLLRYSQNVVGGSVTMGGVSLAGVTSGNTLIFIRWSNDGSATEEWLIEVAGLSQVSPRDTGFDGSGNPLGSGGTYETAFPGATSHKHSATARDQTQPGIWFAWNVSNADANATTPAGFTALPQNDAQRRVFYKITGAAETGQDAPFTTDATEMLAASILSFRIAVAVTEGEEPPEDGEIIDNADICGCTAPASPTAETVESGGGQGAGATPVQYPSIGVQIECAGGGTVPTQADIVHSETWWRAA